MAQAYLIAKKHPEVAAVPEALWITSRAAGE
jgi:hypothetical protein